MTPETQRTAMFLLGCMPARAALAYLAYSLSPRHLQVMGWIALVPALGFFAIWAFGWRKTGPETLGAPIWWNSLRPVHGALYLLFSALAVSKNRHAYMVLAADAALGLSAWYLRGSLCDRKLDAAP